MAGISKPKARSLLANVPEEYVFWCINGHILRNMRELRDEFGSMSNESYVFHTSGEKNDFSNWVADIIKDEELARDLRNAPDQAWAAKTVAGRVDTLAKKLA